VYLPTLNPYQGTGSVALSFWLASDLQLLVQYANLNSINTLPHTILLDMIPAEMIHLCFWFI
jgi:hypothetical protein